MKKIIILTLFAFFSLSTKAISLPGTPTASFCNYCTDAGKKQTAINIANYVGQTIYVVDASNQDSINIDVYKAEGPTDNLTATYQETFGPSSDLSIMLEQALKDVKEARNNIEYELEGFGLPSGFNWRSAFDALQAQQQASHDIEQEFNTAASFEKYLDIIDVSLAQIKDNFGIGYKMLAINLNIAQDITVKFADGTGFVFEIVLIRDISQSKSKIRIGLKFKKAIDKEGDFIPVNAFGMGMYKDGELITSGNSGDLNALLNYALSLGNITIIIDQSLSIPTGSVTVKDCKVVKDENKTRIECKSEG